MLLIHLNSGRWAGGVEILVARFAEYLLRHGVPFVIVDPIDGWMRSRVPQANFIEVENLSAIVPKITHVFVPSIMGFTDSTFPWVPLADLRVFTMVVHPNEVFFCYFPSWDRPVRLFGYSALSLLRRIFRGHAIIHDRLFRVLADRGAIALMDGATHRTTEYFLPRLNMNPEIVPIPTETNRNRPRRQTMDSLSVGYLGRMDGMKWSAIKPFLQYSLGPMSRKRSVQLVAVTEGTHVSKLVLLCKKFGIDLVVHSFMPNNQACELLLAKCDVAVAMGTSALDLAGSGLPTIVIDPALGFFAARQRGFRYIHDTSDWTLGEYRDFPGYVAGRHSFEALCARDALMNAAAEGVKYVDTQHDTEKSFAKLHALIYRSELKADDLAPLVSECIFSMKRIRAEPIREVVRGYARLHQD